jgi:hypothetical protein
MMEEKFYSILLALKKQNPNMKFIICGDFNQLEPVKERSKFEYEGSRALWELVDGNKLNLLLCRRSETKVYDLGSKIINNEPYDITDLLSEYPSYKNICFTNAKRLDINSKCMKRFLDEFKPKITFEVKSLSYDKNTQPYTLCKNMPVISRVNRNSLNIMNNELFKVKQINDEDIEVVNDMKQCIKVLKKDFHKLFLLAFCITTHKSQGDTIDERYCIYEFERFSSRMKYVATSRATKYEYINII